VEDDIKETIRRNAEGRQKYKHDKSVADAHNKSAEGKSPHVIVDEYKKPGTYHDQKSVSDDLLDPKKYIEEAKEWIETLPDETDKDQKLKRRLFKKAKRMKRRLSSAKWRHYMTLDAYNKGAYLGDKAGSAIVGVAGDIMDSIFN
jgi:cell pole-organizing protein PopZ